jgi:hypothetical protein
MGYGLSNELSILLPNTIVATQLDSLAGHQESGC